MFVQNAAGPPQAPQQSVEAATPMHVDKCSLSTPLHVLSLDLPSRLINVGQVIRSKSRPTFLKFPSELYTLVIQGYGGSLQSHRNWLYATIDSHIARGHKIYVHCVLPNDPLHAVSKWKSFTPAHQGYSTFQADVETCKSLLPAPTNSAPSNQELEQTAHCEHSNVHPPDPVQCLWELGDHADDDIAKLSLVRKRAPEIEQVYEDCGDNVCAIELAPDAESTFFETLDNCSDYSDDESDITQSPDHLLWYMMGSSGEANVNPKAEVYATFTQAFPALKARRGKVDVVEVFGGLGGVVKLGVSRGLVPGRNFDLVCGIDLSNPAEVSLLIEYIEWAEPFCVILAPPCTAFGSWANYNKYHAFEAWSHSLSIGLPLANLAARIATLQMAAGRHFIAENPWPSALWKLPAWVTILKDARVRVAYVDQCMYDLKDMNNMFTKKPTAFVASHELLISFLNLKCDGQSHVHSHLAGSIRGVPKTSFAQTWTLKLCMAIIKGISKLKRFYDKQYLVFCLTAYPVEILCPGCKQHASRGSDRHNRGPACRFPYDSPEIWTCPSCIKHQHVHNPDHTKIPGECKWGTAQTRTTNKRTGDPRVPVAAVDEAKPEASIDVMEPPPSVLGKWQPVTSLRLIADLDEIKIRDGWHKLDSGPALVISNGHDVRGPEPRFNLASLPRRSVYGFWPEFSTDFGNWWQLQNNARSDHPGHIGHKVPILVHIFHPADVVDAPSSSPIKIKPEDKDGPPPTQPFKDLMQQWDEEDPWDKLQPRRVPVPPPVPPPRRAPHRFPWDKQPVIDRAEGEEEPEPQSLDAEPAVGVESMPVPDWSSWDLGKALRILRGSSTPMHIRTIRQLHLRWWHCSAGRLQGLLRAAGLPPEISKLAQSVVDTCRVCRLWQRPGDKAITSSRLSLEFNASVQCDLLFWGTVVILHMCDECTRFSMAEQVAGKKASDLLPTIASMWFRIFGPPQTLVADHEGSLCGEEGAIFCERWHTSFKPKPKGSHAYVVERHNSLLRSVLDKIKAQCLLESLQVSDSEIIAEAVYAKNIMIQVHGESPYKAVLGRQPAALAEFENATMSSIADDTGGQHSRHANRLREVAVQSMVEGSAQARLSRAASTQTRVSGQLLDLAPGMAVDIFRVPRSKDQSGWRGPAEVVSTLNIPDGFVDCKWQGRALSVRIADVRKSLVYIALLDTHHPQMNVLMTELQSITDSVQTYALVHDVRGWVLSRMARQHPAVFKAGIHVGYTVFALRCCGVRLGRGVAVLSSMWGTDRTVLLWYPASNPEQYRSMLYDGTQRLNLRQMFGEQWSDVCWMQFLGINEATGHELKKIMPDEPMLGDPPQPRPDAPMPPLTHQSSVDQSMHEPDEDMSGDDGDVFPPQPPPLPPGLPQPRTRTRTPVHTDTSTIRELRTPDKPTGTSSTGRSRSTYPDRLPVNTNASTLSSASSTLPPGWHHVSGKTPGVTPKRQASPSRQHGGASASTDHPPAPAPAAAADVPVPSGFDTDTESLASTIEYNEYVGLSKQYHRKEPPAPYTGWSNCPGMDQAINSQMAYLAEFSVAEGPYAMESCTFEDDCFEIEITPFMSKFIEDAPELKVDEVLVIFVAKNKSKRMILKNLDNLSAQDIRDNWPEVLKAIRKEIASFHDLGTFEIILRSAAENICSSRWVMKFKLVDGVKTVKCRLTVRGYEDLASNLTTFASTASRWGQRLVLSVSVQRKWLLFSWDVASAFLQGLSFQELSDMGCGELRQIAFTPPKDSEQYFRELPSCGWYNPDKHVLNMLKPVYGLRDAPKAWKIKLDMVLRSTGAQPLHTDASLYVWFVQGILQLIVSAHVDDLKGAGESSLAAKVKGVLEKNFGALKVVTQNFEHCGILHEQSDNYETITIHQSHYVTQLQPLQLTSVISGAHSADLPVPLAADYLSLLGGISWCIQTRMDVAIYVGSLQRAAKSPKVEHGVRLNKVLKWIRRKRAALTYKHMKGPCRVVGASDSAFRKECNAGLAMRGAIIGISSDNAITLSGILHVIEFYARRQRRVTRSTYSAELNSLSDAYEFAKLVALTLAEIIKPCPQATLLTTMEETGSLPVCVQMIVDARSVYDSLIAEEIRTPSESSLVMQLHVLKEAMLSHTLSRLWWTDTKDMIADGLNKGACSREALLELGHIGEWILKHKPLSFAETRHIPIISSAKFVQGGSTE